VPSRSSVASPRDRRLQQYVRTTVTRSREVERVGPFLAAFDRHTDHPFLSYAIPDDDARPTDADVAALIAAFEARGRTPRLEYLPTVAPDAEAALLAGGLTVEARLALMTCSPADVVDLAAADALRVELPADDRDLYDLTVAQHAAFGEPPPADRGDAIARQRAALEAGAIAILARDGVTGAVVGGGIATRPADGITELAAIGVLEPYRRRGAAGAITARLAREAFARGVTTAFLTPGGDTAHRVYARAGFAATSVMLHLSRPAS
jgi:predicted GNAT family acetyltransferase